MSAAQRTLGRVVAMIELDYLPPSVLGKNSHAHWRTKGAAFRELKDTAGWRFLEALGNYAPRYTALTMHVDWYQSGRMTDADAVLARLSAVMDAAEAHGLVINDGAIDIGGIRRFKVAHKAEQRVVVTFTTKGAA